MQDQRTTIPFGYCQCGCGNKTNPARQSARKLGWIRGQPLPYLHGHNRRRHPDNKKPPTPKDRTREKQVLQERREAGICYKCGVAPAVEGGKGCRPCIDHGLDLRRQLVQRRRESGLCLACGRERDNPKLMQCRPCRENALDRSRRYAKDNPERLVNLRRARAKRARARIFAHYGIVCACCGEHHDEFLTLDHINNDGATHRRELFGKSAGRGGTTFYEKMRSLGFPPGLQTLCWNCNLAKQIWGSCPHASE